MTRVRCVAGALVLAVCLATAAPAAASSPNTAALQVALRALHLYKGPIDGIAGPQTKRAVRRFQRRRHLRADGVAGPRTRRALGRRGRPPLGSRILRQGKRGWDVAALQFLLRRRGFSPGTIDGGFGPRTRSALRRYQRSSGLVADGLAGPTTLRALKARGRLRRPGGRRRRGPRRRAPVRFLRPVAAPMGDGFGPRWGRMHTGIDFPAPHGRRVGAAGRGVTTFAGYNSGGYGNLVVIRHRRGFETWYAHLSRETSWRGERVVGGTRIGFVGSTGRSTGPHLHFEIRRHGRPINPMPFLLGATASGPAGHAPSDLECPHRRPGSATPARGARSLGSDPATARLAPC